MVPALTVVAKTAPKATKAPPRILRTRIVSGSVDARRTPASSARTASPAGMMASNVMVRGDLSPAWKGGGSLVELSWFRSSFILEMHAHLNRVLSAVAQIGPLRSARAHL